MTARRLGPWLLLAPALLALFFAFALPVGMLLSRAFTEPGSFATLWERPVYLQVLGNTLLISAVATPITLLLGFPVAHAMAHGSARLRRLMLFLVLLPFWTSLLVRSFASIILLQRRGPVNALLLNLGLIEAPLPLLHNLAGLMFGAIQLLLPFVILPLYAVMRRIEPGYMRAAISLGAAPAQAFRRVYLPLCLPGVMTGGALVFIAMLGYFVTPALLGGPRQTMVAQLIQEQVAQFGQWGLAGALSLLLLAAVFLLLGLAWRLSAARSIAP